MKKLFACAVLLGLLASLLAQNTTATFRSDLWFVKFEPHIRAALPEDRRAISAAELQQLGIEPVAQLLDAYPQAILRRAFPLRSPDIDRIYRVEFRGRQVPSPLAECEALSAHPAISYAELAPVYAYHYVPNDYNLSPLRHLDVIDAPRAWDFSRGDSNIVVAVVDAAVLTSHPDLEANIWINRNEIPNNGVDDDNNGYVDDWRGWDASNWDNDPNPQSINASSFNHGTLVGGCVAAVTDNNLGIAGIGFNTRIMAIKTKADGTTGPGLDATVDGLAYALAAGAQVVNMSYGGSGYSVTTQDLIRDGHRRGVIFVASSGNNGNNAAFYPSSYEHVIGVGSTNFDDRVSSFSTVHATVDLMAPGSGIRTTSHSNNQFPTYTFTSGTSFSSPIVAGTIGLMLARKPCLMPDSVEAILERTAVNIDALNPSRVGLIGGGRLDAGAAVAAVDDAELAPVASFAYDSAFSCSGEIPFDLLTTAGCPTSVRWEVAGQTSTEFDPTFRFSSSGSYPLTLAVRNGVGGDTLATTVSVRIGRIPRVDAGGGSAGADTLCIGNSLQLNATTDLSGNFVARWSPAAGILQGVNSLSPTLSPFQSTIYTLAVTGPDGCVGTDEIEIVATPQPLLTPPQTFRVIAGATAQPQINSNSPNLSYWWSPGTFLSDSTVANPIIRPDTGAAGTTITYTIVGIDPAGCTGNTTLRLQILADTTSRDSIPSNIERVFAQAGGRLLSPAPQPAGAEVTFRARFDRPGTLQLELFDLRGQRVARLYEGAAASDYRLRWQRPEDVAPGIYLVRWSYRGVAAYQRLSLR